ncbi:MAG: hypothetical protein ACJA0T_002163 [Colwellia sp.]|jgi:hypothetical protein
MYSIYDRNLNGYSPVGTDKTGCISKKNKFLSFYELFLSFIELFQISTVLLDVFAMSQMLNQILEVSDN